MMDVVKMVEAVKRMWDLKMEESMAVIEVVEMMV